MVPPMFGTRCDAHRTVFPHVSRYRANPHHHTCLRDVQEATRRGFSLRSLPGALTVSGAPSLKAGAQLLVLVNATDITFQALTIMLHDETMRVKD